MAKNETTAPETDAWMPENPGDSLTGVVIDLDVAWSDWRARQNPRDPNGGNYPLISVKQDNGEVAKVHAFRTVLFNEVIKKQPKPGERITVTFLGEGKAKDGANAPMLYRVEVPDRDPDAVAANVYGSVPGMTPPNAPNVAEDDGNDHPF